MALSLGVDDQCVVRPGHYFFVLRRPIVEILSMSFGVDVYVINEANEVVLAGEGCALCGVALPDRVDAFNLFVNVTKDDF